MDRLPDDFVEKYKHLGEKARFYGVPASEFNRDQLLAFIGWMGEDRRKLSEHLNSQRDLTMPSVRVNKF